MKPPSSSEDKKKKKKKSSKKNKSEVMTTVSKNEVDHDVSKQEEEPTEEHNDQDNKQQENDDDEADGIVTKTSFASLGVCEALVDACDHLGWKSATRIQEKVLPDALAGRDIIGLAETGSGKTGECISIGISPTSKPLGTAGFVRLLFVHLISHMLFPNL